MCRQVCAEACVERVALIVIDGRIVRAEIAGVVIGIAAGEASGDFAALFGNLVRVGEVKLPEVRQLR